MNQIINFFILFIHTNVNQKEKSTIIGKYETSDTEIVAIIKKKKFYWNSISPQKKVAIKVFCF